MCGLASPILTPPLSEKTPRSIDTWEPDEVPVYITPTTLLFLYLRPQRTRLNKSLPVWPDYSELSTFKTPRRLARGSHSQRQCSAQEDPHDPGGALEYTLRANESWSPDDPWPTDHPRLPLGWPWGGPAWGVPRVCPNRGILGLAHGSP